MNFINFLKLPYLDEIKDLNSPQATIIKSRIIQRNIFLKNLYTDFYTVFKNSIPNLSRRIKLVELGSGGGFIKELIPDVITSDVIELPNVDLKFSAEHMPFKNETIDRFFALNVIHHIHDPLAFFKEVNRCLKLRGKLIAIEPANTLWGRFINKNFQTYERFDPKDGWRLKPQKAFPDANGALPWIIFIRDRDKFERQFPHLKIKKIIPHTPIRYLISGGLSYRNFLPSWTYPAVKNLENVLMPLNRYIGMYYTIEIEKRI